MRSDNNNFVMVYVTELMDSGNLAVGSSASVKRVSFS